MELDRVSKFLFDKVKLNIIQGKITGTSSLPSDDDIKKEIDSILNTSQNGIIGSITPMYRKDISNSDTYNNNFLTIKDNIEYILGEVYDSLNNIIDITNNSILEKNQVLRDLKMIDRDFSDVEAGTLHNDGLKYVISDSFVDVDKIDTLRTTAQLNLNAGNITLNTLNASYLGFPHYRNQGAINFTITEGFSKIVSQQQTPGTTFGSIFGGDDTDRWELIVTTSTPTTVEGYFALKLSEVGEAVEINAINLKIFSTKELTNNFDMLTIHYLNQDASDRTWKILPGAKIEITGPEVGITFPTIKTTHIRITWTKFYPDDYNNLTYHFSITELAVQKATSVFESVLVTTPLKIEPYQNEQPTIYVAELEIDKRVQPGTNLEFYVATDEPIPGKIVDENDNVVSIDSDVAYAFVPNGIDSNGKPENYYTYASELRDRPFLSGVFPYQYWQPKWQQISPKGNVIKSIPNQLFFNVSEFDNPIHDLYYTNPILWGDAGYSGSWPVNPSYGWATDWSGTGDMPKSGYIWGEDPLSDAGIWWGDGVEYPGWWRPSTPTSSGTLLSIPTVSIPDFNIPVFDIAGYPAREFNPILKKKNPVQKHFWKIFKWPSTSLPIPGTVKISNKNITLDDESRDNVNVWKWNYKSSKIAEDYVIADITLESNTNFFTIELERYLTNRSDLRIIPDSIRDVKFLNISPSEITDFIVEYGREYVKDTTTGLYKGVDSDIALADAHATIVFSDGVINERLKTGVDKVRISLTLSYEAKDKISASWDGYLFVPSSVGEFFPQCHINEGGGHVQKVTVQQISENGLVLQTKEVSPLSGDNGETVTGFSLFGGLNLVRAFTEVTINQSNVIDSSIATWRPDGSTYNYIAGIYMTGDYIPATGDIKNYIDTNVSLTNTISSSIDYNSSGIFPGAKLQVTYYKPEYDTDGNFLRYAYVNKLEDVIVTDVTLDKKTSMYVMKVTPIDITKKLYIQNWSIKNFTKVRGFSYDKNILAQNANRYLTEVDINVLLYETNTDDDSKFSILDDVDGSKYIVVKTPDYRTFPKDIVNNIHFNRTYWDYLQGQYITYTTGTSGNIGSNPIDILTGKELPYMPPNTFNNVRYENVSTYDETINVVDPSSSGFLFWDTAENLEMVYDIKYSLPANNRPCDRIMLMSKLISTDLSMSPVLNSYSLIINNKIRGT
jgi:hypothetical protein